MADMTSADKFGVIFSIAFAAAMIALMGGLLQADTAPATPSMAAPSQTYSPPPTAPRTCPEPKPPYRSCFPSPPPTLERPRACDP